MPSDIFKCIVGKGDVQFEIRPLLADREPGRPFVAERK